MDVSYVCEAFEPDYHCIIYIFLNYPGDSSLCSTKLLTSAYPYTDADNYTEVRLQEEATYLSIFASTPFQYEFPGR